LEKKRLDWTRHLARINHGMLVKEIFKSTPERRRRMGRPRLRCLEDGEKASMGDEGKNMARNAVDREEWTFVIKEAQISAGSIEPNSKLESNCVFRSY
jgi:hypothetical protein